MAKVKLNRAEVEAAADKWALLNPVYHFLPDQPWEDLSPRQRVALLVQIYSGEVDNGGHLQYFHNQGVDQADDLLAALAEMGATAQREIFVKALAIARERPVELAESLEDYAERAYEREFYDLDRAYYACRPELGSELLPDYIRAHIDDFVEFD